MARTQSAAGVAVGQYRMPAEWEPHEATWIAWPHHRDDWPGKFPPIPLVYGEIVRQLHQSEEVRILINGPAGEKRARAVLEKLSLDWKRISFWKIPTNRVWTRDYGPIVVHNDWGSRSIIEWQFNAWAKYPNAQRDRAVAFSAYRLLGGDFYHEAAIVDGTHVVLEGGAIDVNGLGCVLTTEECLLSKVQQRNPGFTRKDYERTFAKYLGAHKTLWLHKGIVGDDTHGHIDDLARFVNARTVAVAVEDNSKDKNYWLLQENLERLQGMTDLDGRKLEVVQLPMPSPVWWEDQRLPASYANFYIANDRVLVPTFNDANDRKAMGILAELFPKRTVVGIHAVDLVWGLGTLHCLTQQLPSRK
ncbi:MAG: agmatine deiminase family protein [Planctomycetia bacterium]|nr:agmatine deiminase family protein [Planctomycetia bacterium]